MEMSPQINELAAALAKAQGAMQPAKKDSENPFFKSKYADLQAVWAACRKPLTDNGLSVVQSPSTEATERGARVGVETILLHTSGQFVRGALWVSAKDDSPQTVGSCISYLKRYALLGYAGVATEDDDAEAAVRGVDSKPAQKREQPRPVAAKPDVPAAAKPAPAATPARAGALACPMCGGEAKAQKYPVGGNTHFCTACAHGFEPPK